MSLFTFTIRPEVGEAYELEATSRDVLNWEKTTKGASLSKFEREATITDIYKIAHFAAVRTQQFTGPLNDWENSVDIEFDQDAGGTSDPT